jgi:hypothetical protein
MRGGFGAAQIGALAARIGADDEEVGARRFAFVRNPGRDHHDIAGAQLDGLPALAAELDPGAACGDAEHFMRRAVVMVLPVDAVAPGIGPAVLGEQPLAGRGAVAAFGQRAAIDDERQGGLFGTMPSSSKR